ncbi:MAG: ABC transporter substrate-binding protein [Halanaerobiales bacterium]
MKNKLCLLLVLMLTVLMTGVTLVQAEEYPVTVEDDLGEEITLEKKPESIISLSPSNTEMLYALGQGDKIIGVTQSANYPEEALEKEKIGTITEPNIEKIVSLEPDLVIASSINDIQSVNRLKELGISVAGFSPATVNDTMLTMKKIGTLVGEEEKVQKIVSELQLQLVEIKNIVDSHLENNERKKVFYEIWTDPLTTAGENTFIDDIINIAGGINIGAEAQGHWPQYSLEKLIKEDPEVYISTPHSSQEEVTVSSIKERDEFETIKAVKNENIHIVNQDIVNRPSPRIIEGLKIFVKAVFPELTEEIEELE